MTLPDELRNRIDDPLCPYCFSPLSGFCPPEGSIKDATLYCSSASCTGRSLGGSMTGYDIKFIDIKHRYTPKRGPEIEHT